MRELEINEVFKQVLVFGMFSVLCSSAALEAQTVTGPNRRVLTPHGYTAATVTFTRPTSGNNLRSVSRFDKPTFYLGLRDPVQIDAGAVYEPIVVNSTNSRHRTKGWAIYLQRTGTPHADFYSRWVGNTNGDEIQDNAFGSRTMTFQANYTTGAVSIAMTGFRTLNGPQVEIRRHGPDAQIKRVVGITQRWRISRNGAYFLHTGSIVNSLRYQLRRGNTVTFGATSTWPTNSPVPEYAPTDMQRIAGPGTPFIINLDPPWGRNADNSDQAYNSHTPSRLQRESVNIDLRRTTLHGRR